MSSQYRWTRRWLLATAGGVLGGSGVVGTASGRRREWGFTRENGIAIEFDGCQRVRVWGDDEQVAEIWAVAEFAHPLPDGFYAQSVREVLDDPEFPMAIDATADLDVASDLSDNYFLTVSCKTESVETIASASPPDWWRCREQLERQAERRLRWQTE